MSSVACAAFLAAASTPAAHAAGIVTGNARHLFDITGPAGDALSLPTDVAVTRDGQIYVVDGGNHRVLAFDAQGKHLFTIGDQGSGDGQFDSPVGIGVDEKGWPYVADKNNRRVQVFDREGNFQYKFPVTSGGHAVRPIDVAVHPDGTRLFVTGNDNHKIMVFTVRGQPLNEFGGQGVNEGEFRYPATITVTGDGSVYVVDVLNTRVQIFNELGEPAAQVGAWGVLPGQLFRPKGVATDGRERVYVSDSYLDVVQAFDGETHFLHVLGRDGEPLRFASPGGIAVGPDGRLYVTEMLGHKVSVYDLGS